MFLDRVFRIHARSGLCIEQPVEDQLQVLLPKLIGTSGNFEMIVFGLVLIAVLKYAPDGLWSFVTKWLPAPRRARDWQGAVKLPARDKPQRGELLLEVDAVRKVFGGLVAVNDVSFAIRAGDIVGLIGPNGAGKSTTFNLVTGVLSLTRGAARCGFAASRWAGCRRGRSPSAACRAPSSTSR